MKMQKIRNTVVSLAMSAVLATLVFVILDCGAAFLHYRFSISGFLIAWGILFLGTMLCRFKTLKQKIKLTAWVFAAEAMVCIAMLAIWYPFQKNAAYRDVDSGKASLYADRSVMVIVPHQDDETNLLSGVLEEFTAYGSQVFVVYATNGDYEGLAETRLQEAIEYCSYAGIPEENVIFLGYGDQWDEESGVNLYNAPAGTVLMSHYGASETYGLEGHPAYRQGVPYTPENYLQDLKSVILEYGPEMIFCVDYDNHIEHKALSLAFEKVMGELLKENPEYRPRVYKGYAYGTAWFAEDDFYGYNIMSSPDLFQEPYRQKPEYYHWEDRIRFPVDASILSRSLVTSKGFRSMELYSSQNAQFHAQSVINGDKVFWQRRTDSVCLSAEIQVSSGDAGLLNNFMLTDNTDLRNKILPDDGTWIPDGEDPEKSVEVYFEESADLYSIVLYDNPCEEENVRNAVIQFDDGETLETGPLHPGGAATEIPVNKTDVRWFSVVLADTQGDNAGLSEVEAYTSPDQNDLKFVKLTDAGGNFVYDYGITEGTSTRFGLYAWGNVPDIVEQYRIWCDNPAIAWTVQGDEILVECPAGEEGTLKISHEETGASDSVYVRNPGKMWKIHTKLGQEIEKNLVFRFQETIVSRLGRRAAGILKP